MSLAQQTRIARAENSDGIVALTWSDGAKQRLHPVWLREQAPDADTRDPITGQRLLDAWSLPLDLTVSSVHVGQGDTLELTFSDGHRTRYAAADLRAALLGDNAEGALLAPGQEAWRVADDPRSEAELAVLEQNPAALLEALQSLHRFGFLLVRGLPVEMEGIEGFARLIGPLRETNWGRLADVKALPQAFDLTMTPRALEAHADNPYREPVPGYVLLHCLVNNAEGGDSTITDGFAAALALRERDPEGFDTLTRTRPKFRYVDEDTVLESEGPLIELDAAGRLKQVRLSNRTDCIDALAPEVLEHYYRARRAFTDIVNDAAFQLRFKLQPGDMLVMDNYRLLHGRSAYRPGSGHRHMRQGYMDRDAVTSRRMILGKIVVRRAAQPG